MEFISTIRPDAIRSWPKDLTYKWSKLLRTKEVHLKNGRETSKAEALYRILLRKIHIKGLRNEELTDGN